MTELKIKPQANNKGEWSELYVLFKIFDEREIAAADSDLEPIEGQKYTFLKVIREEVAGRRYIYDLQEHMKVKILDNDGHEIKSLTTKGLGSKTKKIFVALKDAASSSFVMDGLSGLMAEYLITKVKADSGQKTDLLAVIPDKAGAMNNELGFSVKSHVGSPPTLVNSSSHTNFTYEVTGYEGNVDTVNVIEGTGKVRKRIAALKDAGAGIVPYAVSSTTFKSNLRKADTSFPQILSWMLLDYYSNEGRSWNILSKRIAASEIDATEAETVNIVKNFLRSAALGMVPGTEWDTKMNAYGGYIVVLDDGSIVCYNLLKDDDFRDYLFKHTQFDTPSTTKYKFGKLYEKDGKRFFDLNLQIRFLR